MAMTFNQLTTQAWSIMYNHLQTGLYALSTDNIFSAYNDQLISNVGFPLVIIYPPVISIKNIDMKGQIKRASIGFQIDIFHKTAKDLKTLTDEVIDKLNTGYIVFATNKLRKIKDGEWFSSIDYDSWKYDTQNVHTYSIEVNYKYID